MDNKYPANLDPKLKEAYDRVMGTNVTPAKSASQHHQAPKMVTQQVHNDEPTIVHLGGTNEQQAEHHAASATQSEQQKASSAILMIILGVIGVLFFIGYAIFWAQVLGVNILPF